MKVTIKISDEQGSNGKTTLYCQDLVKKFLEKNKELFPEKQWKLLGIKNDVQNSRLGKAFIEHKEEIFDLKRRNRNGSDALCGVRKEKERLSEINETNSIYIERCENRINELESALLKINIISFDNID